MQDKFNGTMVAAHYLGVNFCIGNAVVDTFRGDKIIYTPADILLACPETVGPPGIGDLFGKEMAEGIGETAFEPCGELASLFVGEARVAAVGLWVLEVYLLMSHIKVSTDNDGFLGIE